MRKEKRKRKEFGNRFSNNRFPTRKSKVFQHKRVKRLEFVFNAVGCFKSVRKTTPLQIILFFLSVEFCLFVLITTASVSPLCCTLSQEFPGAAARGGRFQRESFDSRAL